MPASARQPGPRPETIRTRLARFMPAKSGTGWSLTWTSHTEHRDEIADEEELRASEHLGCYGSAIAHTLANAGAAPTRLKLSVETALTTESETTTLVVEVRAQIQGVDQAILDTVVRRVEPACPVWKALASEVNLRVVPVLEEAQAATPKPESPAPQPQTPPAMLAASRRRPGVRGLLSSRPAWLTPRIGVAMLGILVVGARALAMFGS
jgi:organic hydroperoxide reductase OsmC/OhrA